MKLQILSIVFIALFFSACKNPDENAPIIEYIYANNIPDPYLHAIAGRLNAFEIKMSDDKALSQIKMEFITVTGMHEHEHSDNEPHPSFEEYNQGEWDTMSIANLNGKEVIQEFSFEIPTTVSGGWNVEITVLDAHGNLTTEARLVHIQNDSLPIISVGNILPAPQFDGTIELSPLDSIVLSGHVIDADTIDYVLAEIKKNSEVIWSREFLNVSNWSFNLDQLLAPPLESGSYTYSIYAADLHGWNSKLIASVKVY